MLSGKTGTIQVEKGTATITTITRAKSGNLLVVSCTILFILFYSCQFVNRFRLQLNKTCSAMISANDKRPIKIFLFLMIFPKLKYFFNN